MIIFVISVTIIIPIFLQYSYADTTYWHGEGDGVNWSDPQNWSTNTVPSNNDTIIINGSSVKHSVVHLDINVTTISFLYITIDSNSTLEIEKKSNLILRNFFSNYGTINNFGNVTIVFNGEPFQLGEIDNHGIFNNNGIVHNLAYFDNFATVSNDGLIVNNGLLYQVGIMNNNGLLNNTGFAQIEDFVTDATIVNSGSMNNKKLLVSDGLIYNNQDGIIKNNGILNNIGFEGFNFLANKGLIENELNGIINNRVLLENLSGATINNAGTIRDFCGSTFTNQGTFTGNPIIVNECIQPHDTTTIINPNPGTATVGKDIVLYSKVNDTNSGQKTSPVGSVSWSDGGAGGAFSNSSCTLTPYVGSHSWCHLTYTPPSPKMPVTITASYQGNSIHKTSSGTTTLTVDKRSTSTFVMSNPASTTVGKNIVLYVKVNDTDTGIVTFPTAMVSWNDGGAGGSFGPGISCTLAYSKTAGGNRAYYCNIVYTPPTIPQQVTITANYLGDGSHKTSSGKLTLTVS